MKKFSFDLRIILFSTVFDLLTFSLHFFYHC